MLWLYCPALARISDDLKHCRSAFFPHWICITLKFSFIRKVCLFNRGSVRSENAKNITISWLRKNQYMYLKLRMFHSLCNFKLKIVNFGLSGGEIWALCKMTVFGQLLKLYQTFQEKKKLDFQQLLT